MIITIDGPVASGKSTIGKLLAQKIGAYYLYTGLLYRALAYLLMKEFNYTLTSIGNPDQKKVDVLLNPDRFSYHYDEQNGERILFDGTDITSVLKNALVDQAASLVSANNQVREKLNVIQRAIADDHMMVIDGRDAGSVVFAHAHSKFFLTADEKERAVRWQMQQAARGNNLSFDQALALLRERDQRDMQRIYAPLIIPQGAHVIDTTGMTVEHVIAKMMSYIKNNSH